MPLNAATEINLMHFNFFNSIFNLNAVKNSIDFSPRFIICNLKYWKNFDTIQKVAFNFDNEDCRKTLIHFSYRITA